MLHVKIRRHLAFTLVLLFALLSLLAAYVAKTRYTGRAVHRAAEKAVSDTLGCPVSLDTMNFTDEGLFFKWGSLQQDGRSIALLDGVEIPGMPRPWGPWKPDTVGVGSITVTLDLASPGDVLSLYRRLTTLLPGVLADSSGLSFAFGSDDSDHGEISLQCCLGFAPNGYYPYRVDKKAFLERSVMDLSPLPGWPTSENWSMTVSADAVSLTSSLATPSDKLVDSLIERRGHAVLDLFDEKNAGLLHATWNVEGESLSFENTKGWHLMDDSLAALVTLPPASTVDVSITRFSLADGSLSDLEGTLDFVCPSLALSTLRDLLAAADISDPAGADSPDYFENVHVAASFRLENGIVEVTPLDGRPSLVWAEVEGDSIPLADGSGRETPERLLEKLRSIELPSPPPARPDTVQPETAETEKAEPAAEEPADAPALPSDETPAEDAPSTE